MNLIQSLKRHMILCGATALCAAPVLANPPADAANAAVMAQAEAVQLTDIDPALWLVKDHDTTIYLFGTVHILRPGLSWFDEGVKQAFDQSDELVMEIIEPNEAEATQLIMGLGVDPEGLNLRDRLTDDARAKYEGALALIDFPVAGFDAFEPWFAAITLSSLPLLAKGYDLESGAERALTKAALTNGLPISGLETPEQQFKMFDSLPIEAQIAYLNLAVDAVPTADVEIDKLVDAWGKADIARLSDLVGDGFDGQDSTLYDILLTQRNQRWAQWIARRMDKPGTVFLAVGAAHLAGPDSVQELLKPYNIETQIVPY